MEPNQQNVFNEITIGRCYGDAWSVLKSRFFNVLIIALLAIVIQMPVSGLLGGASGSIFFGLLYFILVLSPFQFVVAYAYLLVVRGKQLTTDEVFKPVGTNYLNLMLASVITNIIIGLGVFLLIVPGIIFAVRLAFVPYLTTERNMDAIEVIKTSWNMTRPYGWTIFGMGLLAIPIVIAGMIVFGGGIVVSIMWIGLAFARMFAFVAPENIIDNLEM
jgi:hypothetical protein